MIRKSLLLLIALSLHADESGFLLEGQLARERKGLDASYIGISTRDTWDISWIASLGVTDFAESDSREMRGAIGLGGFAKNKGMGFVEAVVAGGGRHGGGAGLRVRGAWSVIPHVHLGIYGVALAGKTSRGEVGITFGFHFPR